MRLEAVAFEGGAHEFALAGGGRGKVELFQNFVQAHAGIGTAGKSVDIEAGRVFRRPEYGRIFGFGGVDGRLQLFAAALFRVAAVAGLAAQTGEAGVAYGLKTALGQGLGLVAAA